MNDISKTDQVAKQCRAVVSLATAISELHSDLEKVVVSGSASLILDQIGNRTAALMETLGNVLNETDAVSEDDDALDDVFAAAQKMFPATARERHEQ